MDASAPGAVIAGLGMTDLGRVFGISQRQLAATAVRRAAADAGLALSDLDGLLICPGITGGLDVSLATALGLRDLALLSVINSFGASAVMATQTAALAVTSGMARAVACVFADTPLREGVPAGSAFARSDHDRNDAFPPQQGDRPPGPAQRGDPGGRPPGPAQRGDPGGRPPGPAQRIGFGGLAAGYGFRSVTVHYALAARRHMQRYGTTSEQLGAIAVAQRQWAAGNPAAQYRDPIAIEDHQRSRWVAEPLHLLDCSLVSNGAIAIIITTPALSTGAKPPVHIWGWGQGHPGHAMTNGSGFGLVTGAVQAGKAAMNMAGVGPADITMGQIYDCYTYTVLVTLEDYGFCAKGEGGPYVASGALAPGGSLPLNTGGGQLSGYYMWGFTPLSEAIIQARGEGGDRQSAATDLILVSGNGGILSHHGTLILSPHQRPAPAAIRLNATAVQQIQNAAERNAEVQPQAPQAGPIQPADEDEWPGQPGGTDSVGVIRADARSAEFLAGAARGELTIKRCEGCGGWLSPSVSGCPACGENATLRPVAASGTGNLVSWAVVRHKRDEGPLAVPALVELDEGPWLATGLRLADEADLASLRAGQPVVARFVHAQDGESYPVFIPLPQME